MKSLFNAITVVSLRFRLITLVLVVSVIALGVVAATEMKQELIPPVEFPQTFILAQASGMDSDQILRVVTKPTENQLSQIPELVNVESTTIEGFGVFFIVSNDFGLNQQAIQNRVQSALLNVWFEDGDISRAPLRRIAPAEGEDAVTFAAGLIQDIDADLILYLASSNPNFLFQLSPEFWELLPEDAVRVALAYLANQQGGSSEDATSLLEQKVQQEIVPQLTALDSVANVTIEGGQVLPGDEDIFGTFTNANTSKSVEDSLLLQLSPDVWEVVSEKLGGLGDLNIDQVNALAEIEYTIPEMPPMLPDSWQFDHFSDASDLMEISQSRALSTILNDFLETGEIIGALGQTSDLTVPIVEHILETDPTMAEHFTAEQLLALPDDVFALIPLDRLDGFVRDELASAFVAEELGGKVTRDPVALPTAWQIQPAQIITFSFDDLPLATFSIRTSGIIPTDVPDETASDDPQDDNEQDTSVAQTDEATDDKPVEYPEGPPLPAIYDFLGSALLNAELDTADDLIVIRLPDEFAEAFGTESLRGADFFNFMTQLSDPAAMAGGGDSAGGFGFDPSSFNLAELGPALTECGVAPTALFSGNLNFAELLIGCISADTVSFIAEYDAEFASSLSVDVYNYFSDDVLSLNVISPPLSDEWATFGNQPQFADQPLVTAEDIVQRADGNVAAFLNQINTVVPDEFAGYEVRLFANLSPVVVRYFVINEADFFANLDTDVLLKFSPTVMEAIPQEVRESIDADVNEQIDEIIANPGSSAAAQLTADANQESDIPPADPDAPALGEAWQFIGGFLNIELNNAYDLIRYETAIGKPADFINSLFDTPNGAAFAPDLLGSLSQEAFDFLADNDPEFVNTLGPQALQLLPETIFDTLPASVKEKAESGEVFVPATSVTRTNSSTSLFVTVYKSSGSNVVETFHLVDDLLAQIDEGDGNITITTAFEQASFIETSIEGVAREGTLGAVFAVIIILIFLSGGVWAMRARRISGVILAVVFAVALILVILPGMDAAGGDFAAAFAQSDVVVRVLFMLAIAAGIVIAVWPGALPYPAWRSTLVIGVSIPLSLLMALVGMHWVSPAINSAIAPLAESSPFFAFILRLFPASLTLNIMTLSGLTVAIGRVVDDSIVVLENIFKQLQSGLSKEEAIKTGTRDVSQAIFSATGIAVIVFLPLGLTGGIIGEFFLPFGLAVTYALAGSFIVAITVVPVLAYLFIDTHTVPEEQGESWMQRIYLPVLRWALSSSGTRILVLVIAFVSMIIGSVLFANRPFTFLPEFGEPQVVISVSLPSGTKMVETNTLVVDMEQAIYDIVPEDELTALTTIIGGGGLNFESLIGGNSSVQENSAEITIAIGSSELLDELTPTIRTQAETIFGAENVTVSAGSIAEAGFGGFEMVVSLPTQLMIELGQPPNMESDAFSDLVVQVEQLVRSTADEDELIINITNDEESGFATLTVTTADENTLDSKVVDIRLGTEDLLGAEFVIVEDTTISALADIDPIIIGALEEIDGITNVSSNLGQTGGGDNGPTTFIRVNRQSALSYSAELETEDTLGITEEAIELVKGLDGLPEGTSISRGFTSELQAEGFTGLFAAMAIAILIVVIILILTFNSIVYWLALILSIVVAPVGAAVALTLADRPLGISALIGLLMLFGLVVTNAIVLIDRVQSNQKERGMGLYEALIEGGGRRLRPIVMTALATIIALIPLAIGLSEGAIIAAELGIVVMGGMITSTLLTLIVVPVAYSMLTPLHKFFARIIRLGR